MYEIGWQNSTQYPSSENPVGHDATHYLLIVSFKGASSGHSIKHVVPY